jgi:prolyl-tRNA editing enzyme YbaK/EbsC (Cys-tRNA(Pro) deacylase)
VTDGVVQEVLDLAGVPYELVKTPATARTIVLIDGDRVRMVVIPAGDRIDLERTRRALRAGPGLRLATTAEIAEDFPCFDPRALPPLGHEAVPEAVCLSLLYLDEVIVDGGVKIDPRDLLRLFEPRVADLCISPRRTGDQSPWRSARRPPSA